MNLVEYLRHYFKDNYNLDEKAKIVMSKFPFHCICNTFNVIWFSYAFNVDFIYFFSCN